MQGRPLQNYLFISVDLYCVPLLSEMADGLLDENKNTPSCEKDEERNEEEFSLRCGYRSWRPDFLQRFVNPKWFICALSLFSVTQGKNVKSHQGFSIKQ